MRFRLFVKSLFLLSPLSLALGQEFPMASDFGISGLTVNEENIENFCDVYSRFYVDSSKNSFFEEYCSSGKSSISFISLLDTSVMISFDFSYQTEISFYLERVNQRCSETYPNDSTYGTPGTHQFSEVLYFETMRLRKIGIIENDSSFLDAELKKTIASAISSDLKCPDDIDWAYGGIGPGCCSLVESPSAVFSRLNASRNFKTTKISGNRFRIAGVPNGSEYRLFDLNGKLLRREVYRGSAIEIPMFPVILDIGGKALLLE